MTGVVESLFFIFKMKTERQTIGTGLPKDTDWLKLNKYLLLLSHTFELTKIVTEDLEDEFKIKGIYRQDIKTNLQAIHKKLKHFADIDLRNMSNEQSLAFVTDMEKFEYIVKSFIGLNDHTLYTVTTKFQVGDKVVTMHLNKDVECEVKSIKAIHEINDKGIEEKIVYTLYYGDKELIRTGEQLIKSDESR